MRVLIISDIHANLSALETVLEVAERYDTVWCLGDLVGYGPDPNECIDTIENLPGLKCIIGNHDLAALNQLDSDSFNPEARAAIYWTQKALTRRSTEFLENLEKVIETEGVTLAHGSPHHPVWEYLLDAQTAAVNFNFFATQLCFVGHTHLPMIFSLQNESDTVKQTIPTPDSTMSFPGRAILNPGSVGQPRDRDPRASYAVFDTDARTWEYHRVSYDVRAVQTRMYAAGLPERHIQRLSSGW